MLALRVFTIAAMLIIFIRFQNKTCVFMYTTAGADPGGEQGERSPPDRKFVHQGGRSPQTIFFHSVNLKEARKMTRKWVENVEIFSASLRSAILQ